MNDPDYRRLELPDFVDDFGDRYHLLVDDVRPWVDAAPMTMTPGALGRRVRVMSERAKGEVRTYVLGEGRVIDEGVLHLRNGDLSKTWPEMDAAVVRALSR